MPIRQLLTVLLTVRIFAALDPVHAGETTVAVTALVYDNASNDQVDLVNGLLDLLQVELTTQSNLVIVERRHVNLAMHELALSADLKGSAESQLQLGKIASADLIVTLELKAPETPDAGTASRVLVRIVESQTGAVRGVSVASIDNDRIDQAAMQIAGYFRVVRTNPTQTPVTVAVAPFECKGRFERLRPLELGLRDMFTRRLMSWNSTLVNAETNAAQEEALDKSNRFYVVQRSGMKALLAELELMQSAMVDRSRLPKTLPSRAAAFLVQGQVDETNDDGIFRIVVSGQLINAATNRSVKDFRFVVTPEKMEQALAQEVDVFAGHISGTDRDLNLFPALARETEEIISFFEATLADLRRFRRKRPVNGHSRDLEIKGPLGGPRLKSESALGKSILQKSIDRLETILFIHPGNYEAAYALAFAMSFDTKHQHDKVAEELLRKVAAATEDIRLKAVSLQLLAALSWHYRSEEIEPENAVAGARLSAHAFLRMPSEYYNYDWIQTVWLFSRVASQCNDDKLIEDVLQLCAKSALDESCKERKYLVGTTRYLSSMLRKRSPHTRTPEFPSPELMLAGRDPVLRQYAVSYLASKATQRRDYQGAAEIYVRAATGKRVEELSANASLLWSSHLISATRNFRVAKRFDLARKLLDSVKPPTFYFFGDGYYWIEQGYCYAHEGKTDLAVEVLTQAAERCRGLIDNTRIEEQIEELGGPKLRDDRDIDVTYIPQTNGQPFIAKTLTYDGGSLFAAGGGIHGGVLEYKLESARWERLSPSFGRVQDMDAGQGTLWVATEKDGLWKCDLNSNHWTSFTHETGFPDDRISTVMTTATGTYVGIGVSGAGGLVRIDAGDEVTILEDTNAPNNVPRFLASTDTQIIVATNSSLHVMDRKQNTWTQEETSELRSVGVFNGRDHAWVSGYGRELSPLGAPEMLTREFRSAWFPPGEQSAGYRVLFVIDHGTDVWFGGSPWIRYGSAGFYRFNRKTLDFKMYNLRDGFRRSNGYSVYDGVSIGDDFWLATSAGLAKVTPRKTDAIPTTLANQRHELFLKTASHQEIKQYANRRAFDHGGVPVLEYRNQGQNRYLEGELYLLIDNRGVPQAFTSARLNEQGKLLTEVGSLAPSRISGNLERFGEWKPEFGGSGRRLATVQPEPSSTAEDQLAAMTTIADSVEISVKANQWTSSRRRTLPIHRFSTRSATAKFGAIFAYGMTDDPDVLIKVWFDAKKEKWYWLAAAATSLPLRCSEHEQLIWEKAGHQAEPRSNEASHIEVVLSEHPELVEDQPQKPK